MSELTAIIMKSMAPFLESVIDFKCNEYEENPKYKIMRVEDGFCVYHEEGGFRYLDEAHYLGANKFVSVKMWKFLTKDAGKLRLMVQKMNYKMVNFYKRIGFSIIQEDASNYTMER